MYLYLNIITKDIIRNYKMWNLKQLKSNFINVFENCSKNRQNFVVRGVGGAVELHSKDNHCHGGLFKKYSWLNQ